MALINGLDEFSGYISLKCGLRASMLKFVFVILSDYHELLILKMQGYKLSGW